MNGLLFERKSLSLVSYVIFLIWLFTREEKAYPSKELTLEHLTKAADYVKGRRTDYAIGYEGTEEEEEEEEEEGGEAPVRVSAADQIRDHGITVHVKKNSGKKEDSEKGHDGGYQDGQEEDPTVEDYKWDPTEVDSEYEDDSELEPDLEEDGMEWEDVTPKDP